MMETPPAVWPGGGKDFKAQAGKAEDIAVIVIAAAFGKQVGIVPVAGGMRVVTRADVNGSAGFLHKGFHGTDVVPVAVGEENGLAGEVIVLEVVEDTV